MITKPASNIIKFSHEEVEAMLNLFAHIEEMEDSVPLSVVEQSAKAKLKRIYARQILSHERRQQIAEDNNTR